MTNIYNGIYETIVNLIYGGSVGAYQEFVATQLSTIACILVAILPFVVAFLVIKMLFRVWESFISGGF